MIRRLFVLFFCLTLAWADGLPEDQKKELDRLLDMLGSDDWEVRERATMSLSRALSSGDAVVLYVAERMKSPDPEVKDRVRKLLLDSGHWDASPDLLAEKSGAFIKACEDREMVAWFPKTSNTPTSLMNAEEVGTLSVLVRTPQGVDTLVLPFASKSEIYRRNVCYILAQDLPVGAVKLLSRASEDKDDLVRALAAYGWGRLGSRDQLWSLLVLAKDPSPLVRMSSALALERIPDAGDIPVLLGLLSDEDPLTRYHASYTLCRMTGEDFGFNAWHPPARRSAEVARWKEWWEKSKEGWRPR